MAGKIAEYAANDSINTQPLEQAAYRVEKTGAIEGEAFRQIGQVAQGAVNKYEDAEAQKETTDLAAKATKADLDLTQQYEDAKQKGDPNDPNFANDFITNHVQPALDSMGQDLNTKKGQAMFAELTDKMTSEYGKRAIVDHAVMSGNAAVDTATDAVQNYSNIVTSDPTLLPHASSMLQSVAATIPAEHRGEFLSKANEAVYGAAGKALVDNTLKDPNATPASIAARTAYLDDPANGFQKNMNADTYSALHKQLEAGAETVGNTQSQIDKQALPSLLSRVQNTGVDVGGQTQSLIDNYKGKSAEETAVTKAAMQRQLDASLAYGSATKDVPLAPRQDILNQIGQLDTQIKNAGPKDLENLQVKQAALATALQARDKEFMADPAAYVLNHNPAVQGAYSNFQQAQTPASFAKFAQTSMSEQTRLYPGATPKLVTAYMEQGIAAKMSNITNTPEGATQAGAILNQYQNLSGPYWTQVSHELFADKVINPTQYVAAQMFDRPNSFGLAQDLLRASTTPKADLAATSGIAEAKADKAAAAALAPLRATLGDAANSGELMDAYEKSLTTLIMAKGDINQASALADKMVMGQYQFAGSLRMPTDVNSSAVVAGTKSVLADIGNHKLIAPPSYSNTGPADHSAEYARSVQEYGHWSTNSTGDGALLYDEQGTPVYEKVNGQTRQVSLKFNDLQAIGQKNSLPAKASSMLGTMKGALDRATGGAL